MMPLERSSFEPSSGQSCAIPGVARAQVTMHADLKPVPKCCQASGSATWVVTWKSLVRSLKPPPGVGRGVRSPNTHGNPTSVGPPRVFDLSHMLLAAGLTAATSKSDPDDLGHDLLAVAADVDQIEQHLVVVNDGRTVEL